MKKFLLVLIIAIVVIGGVYILLNQKTSPTSSTSSATPAKTATAHYYNTTYGYSFDYLASDTAQEYAPQYTSVGTTTAAGDFVSVANAAVALSDPSETYSNFLDFAYSQTELQCDADGPTGSVRCPSVSSTASFDTASGLSGQKFYLNQVATTLPEGTASTTVVGPFYAFDISPNAPGSKYAALIINAPLFSQNVNSLIVNAVVESLQIQKIATQ